MSSSENRLHEGTLISKSLCSDGDCWCWEEDRAKRARDEQRKCNHVWVPVIPEVVITPGPPSEPVKYSRPKVVCMLCDKPQENPFE